MMDILSKIDDAVEHRCACPCRQPLPPDGPSMWFATPECGQRYHGMHTTNPGEVYARPDAATVWPGRDAMRHGGEDETDGIQQHLAEAFDQDLAIFRAQMCVGVNRIAATFQAACEQMLPAMRALAKAAAPYLEARQANRKRLRRAYRVRQLARRRRSR